jgi:hypothetical protein
VSERRFAAQARRLAGQVALLLGWRPSEFWAATPAELAAIFEAREDAAPEAGVSRTDLDRMLRGDREHAEDGGRDG